MNISKLMKGWADFVASKNYNHFTAQLIGVAHAKDVQCSYDSNHQMLASFNFSFYEYFEEWYKALALLLVK